MEKEFLSGKGVAFENVFVDEDDAARDYMVEKSGQRGVPVAELTHEDGRQEYLVGFSVARLEKVLGL